MELIPDDGKRIQEFISTRCVCAGYVQRVWDRMNAVAKRVRSHSRRTSYQPSTLRGQLQDCLNISMEMRRESAASSATADTECKWQVTQALLEFPGNRARKIVEEKLFLGFLRGVNGVCAFSHDNVPNFTVGAPTMKRWYSLDKKQFRHSGEFRVLKPQNEPSFLETFTC